MNLNIIINLITIFVGKKMKIPEWYLRSNYVDYIIDDTDKITNILIYPEENEINEYTVAEDIYDLYCYHFGFFKQYDIKVELNKLYNYGWLKMKEWQHDFKGNTFNSTCFVSYYHICG